MRICVDVQSAVTQRSGVGRYTRELVNHLGPLAGDHQLRLFYFDFKRHGEPWQVPHAQMRPQRWLPGRIVQKAWQYAHFPPFDWLAGRADLYHFPNFICPPLARGKSVVTIHDVSFLRYPEFTEEKNRRYLAAQIARTVSRADRIITDSRFSAQEIAALLHVPPERITPIHLGISPAFRPADAAAVDAMRKKYGLTRPYLLTLSTIEPRKNLPFLVDLFENMADFDGELVICGQPGWKYEPILDRIRASKRAGSIRLLGHMADADLPALYTGADLFLCSSFYEGFGFPPLEAMACGTPVLSSAGGSLAEVLGSAAVVRQDFDPDGWLADARRLLSDGVLRADFRQRGLMQAAQYRWEKTAQQTFAVYRELLEESGARG